MATLAKNTILEDDEHVYMQFRPHADRFTVTNEDDAQMLKRKGFFIKESFDGKSWEVRAHWSPKQLKKRQDGGKETYTVGGK